MGVQDWRELTQDRDKGRDLVMAMKTLKEY